MKSDRRHELQQNDLAIYLNKINKSIEPYSKVIAIAVGVLIVGAISFGLYRSQQTANRSDATLQLIQANGVKLPEEYLAVSEDYPDTAAGSWARLYQANEYLASGIQALYTNREDAESLLSDATSTFNRALEGSKDRLLVSRAHFGIARAAESLGNVEDAIAAYEEVISVNESEAMVELAEKRIETLKKPATEEFLVWFAEQDFSPKDPPMPPIGDLNPANVPDEPSTDLPGLKLDFGAGIERDLDGGIGLPEGAAPEEGSNEEPMTEGSGEGLELPETGSTDPGTPDAGGEADPATSETEEATGDEGSTEEPPANTDPQPETEGATESSEGESTESAGTSTEGEANEGASSDDNDQSSDS
ncbi:MAG: tetratricopeptide repeat protein [Planctomycetota bacterium]